MFQNPHKYHILVNILQFIRIYNAQFVQNDIMNYNKKNLRMSSAK